MADQQGIGGAVLVVVSLDEDSHLTGTRIVSSPSPILNAAAISAARRSSFQTEIRGCKGVAADFIFSVDFDASDRDVPDTVAGSAAAPTAVVSTRGEASRPADIAYVHAEFVTRNSDRKKTIASNDAAYEALREKITRTAPPGLRLATGYYDVFPEAGGFVATHEVTVMVPSVAATGAVLAAAADAGATSLLVAYSVRDAAGLYEAAITAAIRNAHPRAERLAAAQHRRVGRILHTDPTFASSDTEAPGTPQTVWGPPKPPVPGPVTLVVRVTVTYALDL